MKIIAIALGLLAVGIDGWWRMHETKWDGPRYIIARRALAPGLALGFTDLTVRLAKREEEMGPGVFTDQEVEMLRGAKVLKPVAAGELITVDKVEVVSGRSGLSREIPKGYRAYLLEAETSVPIVPGDKVDVLVIPERNQFAPLTLLENAQVLTARVVNEVLQVTLALLPEVIPAVEEARGLGRFRLALRSSEEGESKSPRAKWSRKKKAPVIEVISGG